jgi:hypothetical protein
MNDRQEPKAPDQFYVVEQVLAKVCLTGRLPFRICFRALVLIGRPDEIAPVRTDALRFVDGFFVEDELKAPNGASSPLNLFNLLV